MTRQTTTRTFIGANIKGTPAMSAQAVRHDLRVLRAEADVIGLQEFRWVWYWRLVVVFLNAVWRSYPTGARGVKQPVRGAQGILWRTALLARRGARDALLHPGAPGISEDRFLRAVLLADRATGLLCWYGSTHPVVGGDRAGDSDRRRGILDRDLTALDRFLSDLGQTGHPVCWEMDANIAKGSQAYPRLMKIIREHGGTVHGEHGVEYLFTIDGDDTRIEVEKAYVIPTSRLNTDHEARCIRHRLIGR